ncbi:hypothetical protein COBT_003413, partial [Conglomerata obtusa]
VKYRPLDEENIQASEYCNLKKSKFDLKFIMRKRNRNNRTKIQSIDPLNDRNLDDRSNNNTIFEPDCINVDWSLMQNYPNFKNQDV